MTEKEYQLRNAKTSLANAENLRREALQKFHYLTESLKAKEADMKADHARQLESANTDVARETIAVERARDFVLFSQAQLERGFDQ